MLYLVYHQVKLGTDCPDGVCALWIAHAALTVQGQREIQIIPDQYLNASDYRSAEYQLPFTPKHGDSVYLLDFGYPVAILNRILDTGAELLIFDHHKGKMGDISSLQSRIVGGLSLDDCGATFAWRHFFPDQPEPWFLKYVLQRDTGKDGYYDGDIPDSEAIATAMSARRSGLVGEAAFPVFEALLSASPAELLAEGKPQIDVRDRLVGAELSRTLFVVKLSGQWVPILQIQDQQCDRHYSIVGTRLARRHAWWAGFVVILTTDQSSWHLRSIGFNTIPIAQAFGGGGHERASGFKPAAGFITCLESEKLLRPWDMRAKLKIGAFLVTSRYHRLVIYVLSVVVAVWLLLIARLPIVFAVMGGWAFSRVYAAVVKVWSGDDGH